MFLFFRQSRRLRPAVLRKRGHCGYSLSLIHISLDQIKPMEQWSGSQLNQAKEILAFEVTKMIHGEEEAQKAQDAARALFGAGASVDDMPSTQLEESDFADGAIGIIDLLTRTGLVSSRGEAAV